MGGWTKGRDAARPPGRCVHYRAMAEADACHIGQPYATVRTEADGRRGLDRYPCFDRPDPPDTCRYRRLPTPDEVALYEHDARDTVLRLIQALASGYCPHCDVLVTRYRQVGHSVYGEPCGHRLYLGKVPSDAQLLTIAQFRADMRGLEDTEAE